MQKKPYPLQHKAETHAANLGHLGARTVVLYEDYATEVEQLQEEIKTWRAVYKVLLEELEKKERT